MRARIAGNIGEGMAVEFTTFCNIYETLPTIEAILNNPSSGWKVPTEPSAQFAITTLLSHNINSNNISKIITAIQRLPLEFQIVTFKDIYSKYPHLKKHPEIKAWVSANASSMF